MSGWVKLHRSILDWEWYDDLNTFRLFTHCIIKANFEPKNWRGIEIQRGQFWTSLPGLESETGLTVSQIRTSISKLISTGELAVKSQAQGRMITVVHYEKYQEDDRQIDSLIADESQTDDRRIAATNKEKKEEELKENRSDHQNDLREKLISESFEYWWKLYPKKIAKQEAFKKWQKMVKKADGEKITGLTNYIFEDIQTRLQSLESGSDEYFGFDRLHPTTYLNQQRWNDGL